MVAAGTDGWVYRSTMTDPAPAAAMTEVSETPVAVPATSLDRITERIDDLARVIARQAATIERLADEAKVQIRDERAEADAPMLRDLFALHGLAQTFASTSNSEADRPGFEAISRRVERMLTERGGQLVTPFRGAAFDPEVMEAAELADTNDPEADRTVESVIQPGLTVGDRSIRPAKVVVRRYRRA